MVLNISDLSLPTHILQALRGDLSAVNTITASAPINKRAPLTRAPVSIALTNTVNDSEPCELESIELNELTSYDILE